jgi:CRP/FNR family cyclic AMP-dependent transcriptional regulator
MSSIAPGLSRFPIFEKLSDSALEQVALNVHKRSFSAGQVIVLAGDPSRTVYLVVEGMVRVQRLSPEGREYVLHTLGPGQSFNLVSALDGGYNLATVSALTDVVTFVVPCDVFHRMVRDHPEVAETLLKELASRVRLLSDAIEDLALHTVRTRLARCLLSSTKGDAPPAKYWTQDELAAHIGTVRDVVGRTLRTFTREGLIQREQGRVVVTDLAGLRREALHEQRPRYAVPASM